MMDEIEWNVVHEGQLLDAMVGHKPVGVNKYFQMAFICDKLSDNLHKDVNPVRIWEHLKTMYNLEALDEGESIPFPNTEKDFALPESDFGTLITRKEEEKVKPQPSKGGRETPKIKETPKKNEDKTPNRAAKEVPRRDSKDSKETVKTPAKKEVKKETEKPKSAAKSRNSTASAKEDKTKKVEEPPQKPTVKRTRGSLKPNDDSGSSGKSSPVTVTPSTTKRRRI